MIPCCALWQLRGWGWRGGALTQGGVNSEALELFDQEDVRHRVVGLAEVQEGGVEAVPALTPATGTARVVVVLV